MRYEAAQELPILSSTRRLFASFDDFDVDDYIADALKPMARADVSRLEPRVVALKNRGANWDGRGSAGANHEAVDRAIGVLDTHALQVREAKLPWHDPHMGLNEDGDVVFEWWNGNKKLTLYISKNLIEYVSSWGPNVDHQMHAGVLDGELLKLWQWFVLPPEQ